MTTAKKLLSNSLIQLIVVMITCTFCHSYLSLDTLRFFLTISSIMREMLIFVLPFLLFSFVAVALSAIPKEGMLFVFGLLLIVFISNFANIIISGSVGFLMLSGASTHAFANASQSVTPLFDCNLPPIISTGIALLLGVFTGFYNSFYPNKYIMIIIKSTHSAVMKFMKRFFIPFLPIFVGGFLLKLFAEGRMTNFVNNNFCICLTMCTFLMLYLLLWLMASASFKIDRAVSIFKNIFPAILTAFSTMSSAAALPFSITAAEKNTNDKILSNTVMPLTLNFHMVGDTILIPIMAMVVLLAFDHPLPSVYNFLMFGVFFVLNKFAGAGVPSGTIMVTVPVLKQYLGFDDSMIAFMVAFYGVIDPIATAGNVCANNCFVLIFQKLRNFIKLKMMVMFKKKDCKCT